MIGTRLVEDGSKAIWQITAERGGLYVICRLDKFQPPQEVTVAELASRWKIETAEPAPRDEGEGWGVLAERFRANSAAEPAPPGALPEEVFAAANAAATAKRPR